MKHILAFLEALQGNNNREWFTAHKAEYEQAKAEFELIVAALIREIARFDRPMAGLDPKACVFRIYRDIRFSFDKTPYKTHFGAYMAFPGGRKSERGGYYLHVEPQGGSFLAVGVWSPQPPVLKALRQSVVDNFEEFDGLIRAPEFREVYADGFYTEDALKRLPPGFPPDFPRPDWLKLKHYLVSYYFRPEELTADDLVGRAARCAEVAYPFLCFLNYTIDEFK